MPLLTAAGTAPPDATIAKYATDVWSHQVRFVGAGTIGIAAVWTLLGLLGPMVEGVRASFAAVRRRGEDGDGAVPRTERDMPVGWLGLIGALLLVGLVAIFARFLSLTEAPLGPGTFWGLVALGVAFAFVFGFLIAAACGYMAGLVGSSASPISGIGILAVVLVSLLLLAVLGECRRARHPGRRQARDRRRALHHLGDRRHRLDLERQPPGPQDRLPRGRHALAAAGGADRGLRRRGGRHPADPRPALLGLRLPRRPAPPGHGPRPGAGRTAGHADGGDRDRHLHPQARLVDDPDRDRASASS